MRKTRKQLSALLLFIYVVGAGWTAGAFHAAIPAMNAFGLVYVGATWPLAIVGVDVVPKPGTPLANAMFTFK